MASEVLAEKLYRAWLDSDRNHPAVWKPPSWLELEREERDRWREVAAAASAQQVEDWHGKAT